MNSTTDIPTHESISSPGADDCRALAQRIAASSHFRRSARLRDFLLYVVRRSLLDPHAELNEQEIGEKVFGRSASYDRSQDNIVRVNATELRRRIDLYFAEEGADEPFLLEIPRGGYKPVFHRRPVHTVSPPLFTAGASLPQPQTLAAAAPPATVRPRWPYLLWALATVVLIGLCAALWIDNRAAQETSLSAASTPALNTFWGEFSRNHRPVDIVLPDDSVSVIEDISQHPVSLQDYLSSEYMRQVQSSNLSADRKADLNQIFSHNLITFGGVRAAQLTMAHIPSTPAPHLTLSRYYTADAMKRDNVVLIGGSKANPWADLLADHMNFIVGFDYAEGHALVTNQHPRPGEQAIYTAPLYPNALTGYSVVAYLPSPGRIGDTIILAGMDSDSTSAAAEFLASEPQLEKLQSLMKVKQFPYFEVLLRISRVSGTSFGSEIVAYRTYPKPE